LRFAAGSWLEQDGKKEKPGFYEFAILKEENHIGGISLYLDNERKTGELGMKRISCTGGRFNKIAPTEEWKEFLYKM
jgi:hypothetical protein